MKFTPHTEMHTSILNHVMPIRYFCERDYLATHGASLRNVFHSDTDVVFQAWEGRTGTRGR